MNVMLTPAGQPSVDIERGSGSSKKTSASSTQEGFGQVFREHSRAAEKPDNHRSEEVAQPEGQPHTAQELKPTEPDASEAPTSTMESANASNIPTHSTSLSDEGLNPLLEAASNPAGLSPLGLEYAATLELESVSAYQELSDTFTPTIVPAEILSSESLEFANYSPLYGDELSTSYLPAGVNTNALSPVLEDAELLLANKIQWSYPSEFSQKPTALDLAPIKLPPQIAGVSALRVAVELPSDNLASESLKSATTLLTRPEPLGLNLQNSLQINNGKLDASQLSSSLLGQTITVGAEQKRADENMTSSLVSAVSGLSSVSHNNARVQMPVAITFGQQGWADMVAERSALMASQNIKFAELQLDPPELGPLQVKVTVNQDQATVSFVAANTQVKDALEMTAVRLRELLEQQGVNLVDVDVSDQSSQQGESAQSDSKGEESQVLDDSEEQLANTEEERAYYGVDFYA